MSYAEFLDHLELRVQSITYSIYDERDLADFVESLRPKDRRLYWAFDQAERRMEIAQSAVIVEQDPPNPLPFAPAPGFEAVGLLLAAATHSGHGLYGVRAVLQAAGRMVEEFIE
jgi:hypothetical protein